MGAEELSSFVLMLERLEANDPKAQSLVVERFTPRLIALARRRLHPRLRTKIDPEDVVQSVYRSFFLRQKDEGFDLKHWENLWALLTAITWRKCCRQAERFHAAQRDVKREAAVDKAGEAEMVEAVDREPTAEEAAMVAETVEEIMKRLNSERKQKVLELSLQGYSVVEISEQIGHYERGVRRIRDEIRLILEELAAKA